MASRKLEVQIVGDADSLNRAFKSAGASASSFGSKLGSFAKASVVALGAAGIGGAIAALKVGFDEASESAKVLAQTDAVLKSTAGAANVTAEQVEQLAGSLSKMSGVDDEAIQSGENLLLTFTKVRNEAGKGNKVFDMATRAALDMSVAMGKDMTSSAMLVGKALNDPVKGMSALSRAGIQFTKDQKATVLAMVESGNAMGAQKIILAELERQFGGSAKAVGETLPGQLAKAKLAFEEVAGRIVTALMPALTWMLAAFTNVLDWLERHWSQIKEIVGKPLDAVVSVLQDNWPKIKATVMGVVDAIRSGIEKMGEVAKSVFGFFDGHAGRTTVLMSAVAGLTAAIAAYVVVTRTVAAVTKAWAAAQAVMNAVMAANPLVLIATLVIALGVALVVAYKRSETFRNIVNNVFEKVKAVVTVAMGVVRSVISGAMRFIGPLIDNVKARFDAVIGVVTHVVGVVKALFTGDWRKAWQEMKKAAVSAWNLLNAFLLGIPQKIIGLFADAGTWLWDAGIAIVQGLWDGMVDKWHDVANWLSGLAGIIKIKKGPPAKDATLLTSIGQLIINGLDEGMRSRWAEAEKWLTGLGEKMQDRMRAAVDRARAAVDASKSQFSSAWSSLAQDAIGAFDAKTQQMLDGVNAKLAAKVAGIGATLRTQLSAIDAELNSTLKGINKEGNAKTPAEKQLEALQKSREKAGVKKEMSSAVGDLNSALTGFKKPEGEETPQEAAARVAAREDAIAQAKERIWQLDLDAQQRFLEAQAEKERTALDGKVTRERNEAERIATAKRAEAEREAKKKEKDAEKEATRATLELQALRNLQRRHFEERLAALETQLTAEGAKRGEAQTRTIKLLESFGVNYQSAGQLLGAAFSRGLDESADAVNAAARRLAEAAAAGIRGVTIAATTTAGKKLPGRASGGPVMAGHAYMVGERGPEVFVPGRAGGIVANGSGGGTVVNLTVNGWVGNDQDIAERVRQELVRYGRRNPSIFSGVGVTA